jgi:hypothetical protein
MDLLVISEERIRSIFNESFADFLIKQKHPIPIAEKSDLTDINGAAEETGLSKSTIYQRGDKMPRIKTPKKVIYSRKALREWVEAGMPDVSKAKAANELAQTIKKRV